MIKFHYVLFCTVWAALCCVPAASSDVRGGRHFEPGKRFRISVSIGDVSLIDGSVVETNRPINDFRPPEQRDNAESFSLADLGLLSSKKTFGLSLEKGWKYLTWFTDATHFSADTLTVAPRDLYLGVQEVQFQDATFRYQQIAEGSTFDATLDAVWLNSRLAVTPVTFNQGGSVQFVPWIHFGLFGLVGASRVYAGPATGVIQYENPPRDYVQGGSSKGDVMAFAPEVGVGGELTFAVGRRSTLLVQGNYSIFDFAGTTSELGVGSRNEKAVDLDYSAIDGRILYVRPMTKGSSLVFGAEFRTFLVDARVSALERSVEEILTLREKFNKDLLLELSSVNMSIGFRF